MSERLSSHRDGGAHTYIGRSGRECSLQDSLSLSQAWGVSLARGGGETLDKGERSRDPLRGGRDGESQSQAAPKGGSAPGTLFSFELRTPDLAGVI